jgi:hypothetical protein
MKEMQWPHLAGMAKDILATPATEVDVEQLCNVGQDACYYCHGHLKLEFT